MSTALNKLLLVQREILIMLRRQKVPTQRITVSLKAIRHDCPDPLLHLQVLVQLEFVACEASAEGQPSTSLCRPAQVRWFLTDRGAVSKELLRLEQRFDNPPGYYGPWEEGESCLATLSSTFYFSSSHSLTFLISSCSHRGYVSG